MNENKIKLLAWLLAISMTCTACATNLDDEEVTTNIETTITTEKIPTIIPDNTTETTQPTIKPEETKPVVPPTTQPEETKPAVPPTTPEETKPVEPPVIIPEEKVNAIVTATTTVNVRAGNSINALKIGNLKIGESAYRILSNVDGWDLIKTDNFIGYVYNEYLEYTQESEIDEFKHERKKDIVLTTTDLNFRTGPDTSYEKIDRFPTNTELEVIAKTNNNWYLVNYNGTLGYVSGDYTKSILDKIREEYPQMNLSELDVKKIVYSNATKLNFRSEPNTDCEIIGEFTRYETARVLKEENDWYFVLTNDYNLGFISKSYTKDLTEKFVVVDLSSQRLWLYNNDELYLTTKVTTGKDSTPSDIGYFKIYAKQEDRYLSGPGYKSWVEYWMPYNGGEGLHDASWRSQFGGEDYHTKGSHGCINIPPKVADDIYHNVEVGTKVLVHK